MWQQVNEHIVNWYVALTKTQKYLFYLLTFNVIGSTFITIMSYFISTYFDIKFWAFFLAISIGFMYRFVMRTLDKQRVVNFGQR